MEGKSLKFETLQEAQAYIASKFNEGTTCPCCNQYIKLYRYKLYDTSAMALIKLYNLTKITGREDHHVSQYAEKSPDHPRASHFAELRHWGLITKIDLEQSQDPERKKSSGFWAITEKGKAFVEGSIKVPEMIKMFNNEFFGFEGENISIQDALKNKFSYDELMSGKYVY